VVWSDAIKVVYPPECWHCKRAKRQTYSSETCCYRVREKEATVF